MVAVSDFSKSIRSRELYDLASSSLVRFGATEKDSHHLVFDLAELVDAGPHLARLASELGQTLTDSESVEGRVQLLNLLKAIRSWLQLEICKHAESFARLSEGVEGALWDQIIADGMGEEELSRRLLVLSERRAEKPKHQ